MFDGYRQRTEMGKVYPYRKIFTTETVQINAPQKDLGKRRDQEGREEDKNSWRQDIMEQIIDEVEFHLTFHWDFSCL